MWENEETDAIERLLDGLGEYAPVRSCPRPIPLCFSTTNALAATALLIKTGSFLIIGKVPSRFCLPNHVSKKQVRNTTPHSIPQVPCRLDNHPPSHTQSTSVAAVPALGVVYPPKISQSINSFNMTISHDAIVQHQTTMREANPTPTRMQAGILFTDLTTRPPPQNASALRS